MKIALNIIVVTILRVMNIVMIRIIVATSYKYYY